MDKDFLKKEIINLRYQLLNKNLLTGKHLLYTYDYLESLNEKQLQTIFNELKISNEINYISEYVNTINVPVELEIKKDIKVLKIPEKKNKITIKYEKKEEIKKKEYGKTKIKEVNIILNELNNEKNDDDLVDLFKKSLNKYIFVQKNKLQGQLHMLCLRYYYYIDEIIYDNDYNIIHYLVDYDKQVLILNTRFLILLNSLNIKYINVEKFILDDNVYELIAYCYQKDDKYFWVNKCINNKWTTESNNKNVTMEYEEYSYNKLLENIVWLFYKVENSNCKTIDLVNDKLEYLKMDNSLKYNEIIKSSKESDYYKYQIISKI